LAEGNADAEVTEFFLFDELRQISEFVLKAPISHTWYLSVQSAKSAAEMNDRDEIAELNIIIKT
jgi:hypothetical protein